MLNDKIFRIKCRHNGKDINKRIEFYNYINDFPVFVSNEDTNCYIVRSNKYGSLIVVSRDILTYLDSSITKAIITNTVYSMLLSSVVYDIKDRFKADIATAKECGQVQTKAALLIMKESFNFNESFKEDLDIRLKRLNEYTIEECAEGTHTIDLNIIKNKLEIKS